jgi:hypothetical protein
MRQRCARWLLQTHDRVGTVEFPLTQRFPSQMLACECYVIIRREQRLLDRRNIVGLNLASDTSLDAGTET